MYTSFVLDRIHCVLVGELEGVLSNAEEGGQKSRIGDDVPAKCQRDVLVSSQTVSIIPEIIFRVHVLEVQHSVFTTQDYFIPKNHLKKRSLKYYWILE